MNLPAPDAFTRAFSSLWGQRDAAGIAALCAPDADMLTLTGLWCEDRKAIEAALAREFAGALARARLVTGKVKLRMLGPGAAIVHQRFVLSGLVTAEGHDAGRMAALLTAVLIAQAEGWRTISAQFSALDG